MSLSDLPENILLHIISFLPVDDAINTSLLAKPWRNIWTLTPFLYFDQHIFEQRVFHPPMASISADSRRLFAKFVDRVLILHNAPRLLRLDIIFEYDPSYCSHVDSWIRFAARRGVQVIRLNFGLESSLHVSPDDRFMPYEVPVFALAAAPSLRSLKLVYCVFHRPLSGFFLLSLESLTLSMDLTDDNIPDIIAACPLLETLVIRRCSVDSCLKVVSQRLKNLSIISSRFYSVEISAPTLRSFRWIDSKMDSSNIKDVDSLVYAEIMFRDMPKYSSCWREMMDAMSHVRVLTCQNLWFQYLDISEKPWLNNLKYLEIVTRPTKLELVGLIVLLLLAPNLETLVLRILQPIPSGNNDDDSSDEITLDEILDKMRIGLLPHLKEIKIKSFTGMESEVFVIKFLLKCEMVLEKMTLLTDNDGLNDAPEEPLAERFKELLLFARSSTHAQIVLV